MKPRDETKNSNVFRVMLAMLLACVLFAAGCEGDAPADILSARDYTGYLLITSVTTDPATGPGLATMFDPTGDLYKVIADYVASGTTYASGAVFRAPNMLYLTVEPSERVDYISIDTGETEYSYSNSNMTAAPLRQMAYSGYDQSIFVSESNINTVEKLSSNWQRVGAPFIPASVTTGATTCTITTVISMAVIPEDGRIGVLTSNRLNIYDKDGNCLVTVSGAPVNASTPWGLAYHPTSGKFLITRVGDHSVWSIDPDGTNATQIYVSATFINTPRAIDADDDGYIYVSSSGSDTIEKLYYDGTGVATRALTVPLIGPNVFTQNVQQISVMRREP